jgi:hypothetical protein
VVSPGPNWLVKIADFGLARLMKDANGSGGTLRRGTVGYIAPEMLDLVREIRSFPADMWSLGAVLYRLLVGRTFLDTVGETSDYVQGRKQFPSEALKQEGVSPEGIDFLQKLLAVSPLDRMTAEDAVKHAWIQPSSRETLTLLDLSDATSPEASSARKMTIRISSSTEPSEKWTWDSDSPMANPETQKSKTLPSNLSTSKRLQSPEEHETRYASSSAGVHRPGAGGRGSSRRSTNFLRELLGRVMKEERGGRKEEQKREDDIGHTTDVVQKLKGEILERMEEREKAKEEKKRKERERREEEERRRKREEEERQMKELQKRLEKEERRRKLEEEQRRELQRRLEEEQKRRRLEDDEKLAKDLQARFDKEERQRKMEEDYEEVKEFLDWLREGSATPRAQEEEARREDRARRVESRWRRKLQELADDFDDDETIVVPQQPSRLHTSQPSVSPARQTASVGDPGGRMKSPLPSQCQPSSSAFSPQSQPPNPTSVPSSVLMQLYQTFRSARVKKFLDEIEVSLNMPQARPRGVMPS